MYAVRVGTRFIMTFPMEDMAKDSVRVTFGPGYWGAGPGVPLNVFTSNSGFVAEVVKLPYSEEQHHLGYFFMDETGDFQGPYTTVKERDAVLKAYAEAI